MTHLFLRYDDVRVLVLLRKEGAVYCVATEKWQTFVIRQMACHRTLLESRLNEERFDILHVALRLKPWVLQTILSISEI